MNIICMHGLGQKSTSWTDVFTYVDKQIEADCPSLFPLEGEKELSYSNLYSAFEMYCNEKPDAVHLCGISLGAILAMNYAVDHPERVKSLVLIAPQYKMPFILMKIQNFLFRFMPKAAFEKMGMTKRDVIKLTNSMLKLNFSKNLQKISCPTAVVCGTKDYANKKAAKMTADHISRASIYFIDGAGHEVNIQAPEKLAEVLHNFYGHK